MERKGPIEWPHMQCVVCRGALRPAGTITQHLGWQAELAQNPITHLALVLICGCALLHRVEVSNL